VKEISIPKKKAETFDNWSVMGDVSAYIRRLELEMDVAAANLDYERAASIRDELISIRKNKR
jgi:excinuclease UvrABC helicase subunit UvrB